MKTRLLKISFITIILAWLTSCSVGQLMLHEKKSPYPFDKTVATIIENAKARQWAVPKIYDFQKTMLKHNHANPGQLKVLKICQPKIASQMFSADDRKYVSAMMPCSISVYTKADGDVYVSSMNMSLMSHAFNGEIGQIMTTIATEDEKILNFLQK